MMANSYVSHRGMEMDESDHFDAKAVKSAVGRDGILSLAEKKLEEAIKIAIDTRELSRSHADRLLGPRPELAGGNEKEGSYGGQVGQLVSMITLLSDELRTIRSEVGRLKDL